MRGNVISNYSAGAHRSPGADSASGYDARSNAQQCSGFNQHTACHVTPRGNMSEGFNAAIMVDTCCGVHNYMFTDLHRWLKHRTRGYHGAVTEHYA